MKNSSFIKKTQAPETLIDIKAAMLETIKGPMPLLYFLGRLTRLTLDAMSENREIQAIPTKLGESNGLGRKIKSKYWAVLVYIANNEVGFRSLFNTEAEQLKTTGSLAL